MSVFKDPRMRPKLAFSNLNAARPPIGTGFSAGAQKPSQSGFHDRPPGISQPEPFEERPKAVTWDEQGRLLDENGNIISLKVRLSKSHPSIVFE